MFAVAGRHCVLVEVVEVAEVESVSKPPLRSNFAAATQSAVRDPSFSTEGYPFEWQQRFPFRFRIGQMP